MKIPDVMMTFCFAENELSYEDLVKLRVVSDWYNRLIASQMLFNIDN